MNSSVRNGDRNAAQKPNDKRKEKLDSMLTPTMKIKIKHKDKQKIFKTRKILLFNVNFNWERKGFSRFSFRDYSEKKSCQKLLALLLFSRRLFLLLLINPECQNDSEKSLSKLQQQQQQPRTIKKEIGFI